MTDVPESPDSIRSKSAAPLGISFKYSVKKLFLVSPVSLISLMVMSVLRGLMPGVQVFAIGALISAVASEQTLTNSVYWYASILGAVMLGSYILENLIKFLSDRITMHLSLDTDLDVIDQLCSFEVQDFEKAQTYDSIQRVDSGTGEHIFGLFDTIRTFFQSVLSILGIAVVIWAWSPLMAGILLVAPIPGAIATFRLQSKAYEIEYERAPQERFAAYFRGILTSDSARKELKVFKLSRFFAEKYKKLRLGFLAQDMKIVRYHLTQAGTLGLLSTFANIIAIFVGANIALAGGRVGELAGFISASTQMNALVMSAFIGLTGVYQHLLYVSNWVAVMHMSPSDVENGTQLLSNLEPIEIEFREVSFVYPGTQKKVLDAVSFVIPSNKISALVGLNGSGKTTICKLLLRFYNPDSGEILLNGRSIKEFDRDSLYLSFSALFQDFIKFEQPFIDNIGYGNIDIYDSTESGSVEKSIEMVGLSQLVNTLPQGLETMLGRRFEGGHQLSVGQWQRLATARALFKKPRLLILDEPTASVDAVSEKAMFEAIAKIDEEMTILLVAHRFATISHAEHIIVLHEGRVVDQGTHAELLRTCEQYAQLHEAQNMV